MALSAAGVQNYNNDLIQTITYNENNDPVQINGEKNRVHFDYGLGSMRQRVDIMKLKEPSSGTIGTFSTISTNGIWDPNAPVWENKETKFYSEDGSFEVVSIPLTGYERHILYIAGTPYESNIVYLKDYKESAGSYKYLHKDYLGSILAITDEEGNKLEGRHYDAWGNFTHLKKENGPVVTDKTILASANLLIDRGYTSHEHFMQVGIIHMNGRLYDPLLRRFLNADENIQDPSNTQNYNKYGYVMNNPLIYSDPDGEFWWMVVGAIVGGYLNGVHANGGNWNPGKWDWKNNWGAVLGGAIGGASIAGALGNITSNPGAIKNMVSSVVSGGLNSAFSGSNFLSGMVSGISYSANVFNNTVTSTDGLNAGYRYIVSPESDAGGGWEDLTKTILLNYVKTNFCETCSTGALQQMAGKKFEEAFNTIMGIDYKSLNYQSNGDKIAGIYKGKLRNTIPDGIFDLIKDEYYSIYGVLTPIPKKSTRFPGVQFAEVKAMDGTLYSGSNQGQISSMLYAMSKNNGVNQYGGQFIIGTTSDTKISPNIITQGIMYNIQILHITAQYRTISGAMQMRLYNGGASPSSAFIK